MTTTDTFTLRPMAEALGAEVEGVDLARPVGAATAAALERALAEHLLLVFRDQDLTRARHKAASRMFGELMRLPYVAPLPEDPDVIAVLKEADERDIHVFGGQWHSDFSFLARPPKASALYALEVPETGGDTLWASTVAAYAALPDAERAELAGRTAMHTGRPYGTRGPGADARTSRSIAIARDEPAADAETPHPAVRRQPETGRLGLFVNPTYTARLDGESEETSAPRLAALYAHMTQPAFTCRLAWRPGTLAVWDNRMTLHLAPNDYDGRRRLLHRTTIAGERPEGPAAAGAERRPAQ